MELELVTFLIVCPLVFLAGFIDSIAGGGGLISLPAYLIAGIPPHFALGTNKLSSVIGTVVSMLRFWKNKYVDIAFILPSVAVALCGSYIGANLILLVNENILQYMLMVALPLTAVYVFRLKHYDESKVNSIPRRKAMLIALIISFFCGGYDGFYGPGAGTFLILLFTAFAKMEIRMASGNAKLINLSSNFAAFIVFLLNGKVIFTLGLTAALFSIAGNYLGAGFAIRNGLKVVRPVVLVVLCLLFVKIVSDL